MRDTTLAVLEFGELGRWTKIIVCRALNGRQHVNFVQRGI